MKAYLVTTGLLFAVLAVLHVWRAIAEWPQSGSLPSAGFLLFMAALVLVPGALSAWAWVLLRKTHLSQANDPARPAS